MTAVTALSKGEVVGNAVSAKPVASSGSGGGRRGGNIVSMSISCKGNNINIVTIAVPALT